MKYKVKKNFLIDKIGDKIFIYSQEKSIIYILNKTASEIFKFIKKGFNSEDIIIKISKKYKKDISIIKKDFKYLINDLLLNEIIEKLN